MGPQFVSLGKLVCHINTVVLIALYIIACTRIIRNNNPHVFVIKGLGWIRGYDFQTGVGATFAKIWPIFPPFEQLE